MSLDGLLLLGLKEGDGIGEGLGGTQLAGGVITLHDLDLDTKDTLSEENVSDGVVDELLSGLTGVDHETISELHGLSSGSSQFTRDNNFTTLGTGLHNESENTVAGSSDGKTTEELVSEGLSLGDGGKTSVSDLLGVKVDGALSEGESLGDKGGELPDPDTLLTEDILSVGSSDDDLAKRKAKQTTRYSEGERQKGSVKMKIWRRKVDIRCMSSKPDTHLGLGVGNSDLTTGVTFSGELGGANRLVKQQD